MTFPLSSYCGPGSIAQFGLVDKVNWASVLLPENTKTVAKFCQIWRDKARRWLRMIYSSIVIILFVIIMIIIVIIIIVQIWPILLRQVQVMTRKGSDKQSNLTIVRQKRQCYSFNEIWRANCLRMISGKAILRWSRKGAVIKLMKKMGFK